MIYGPCVDAPARPWMLFSVTIPVVRIGLVLILAAQQIRAAADLPMTLISENETEPIHGAILRKEAWTQDAVRRLRADADKRMTQGPWTITASRPKNIELELHDYYSEAIYYWPDPDHPGAPYVRQDGHANPGRFMDNRVALNAMCDAVFSLGAAAFLLDNAAYAQRAARLVNAWFVNPKTRMNPHLEYAQTIPGSNTGRPEGVLDGRVFIPAIQGMEFLAATGSWDAKDQQAVHKWFEDYLHWLMHSRTAEDEKNSGNNHASWYAAQLAAVASYVGDNAAEQSAFAFYRANIFPRQIRKDGSAPREEARTRSLSYSAFNLEAFATLCRIAQVQGVDLWTLEAKNGASVATVIDYLAPYLSDPHKWNKEQIVDFESSGLYSLAFAGMGLKKPDYVALYRKVERPEGAWMAFVDLIVGRWESSGRRNSH
jgi:Alginate lyase